MEGTWVIINVMANQFIVKTFAGHFFAGTPMII